MNPGDQLATGFTGEGVFWNVDRTQAWVHDYPAAVRINEYLVSRDFMLVDGEAFGVTRPAVCGLIYTRSNQAADGGYETFVVYYAMLDSVMRPPYYEVVYQRDDQGLWLRFRTDRRSDGLHALKSDCSDTVVQCREQFPDANVLVRPALFG